MRSLLSEFDSSAGDRISKSFCVLPWIHRFTNIGGEIQVCCVSEEFNNDVKNGFGRPMNIKSSPSDEDIMNSSFMKKVRKKMIEGEWPDFCTRCLESENGNGISRRIAENNRFRFQIDEMKQNTLENGELKEVQIKSADFRLGNLCNLACRMCNPKSSSKWIKEWNQVKHNWFEVTDKKLKEFASYDWYKNSEIWKKFEQQIPNLEHLHFAGGEPLLIPQMTQLLERCVEVGCASNISLTYNTNMTILTPKIKKLWTQFKEVRVFASIDAVGVLNDYIRYPSTWTETDKMLREMDNEFSELNLQELTFATTVQIYNILNIRDIFDYTMQFKNITPFPNLINLYNPDHYRSQVLSQDLKESAKEQLVLCHKKGMEYLENHPEKSIWKFVLDSTNDSLHFMLSENLEESHKHILAETIASKDRSRNQELKRVSPELAKWLST